MSSTQPATRPDATPPTAVCFVFVDLTTDATPEAMRPAQALPQIIAALQEQIQGEFAAAYGAVPVSFRVASSPTDRATNEYGINLRDTIDVQGALAYHQVINGVPDIEVAVDLSDGLTQGQEPVSSVVDHEVLELLRDLGANGWKDRQDSSGEMDAEEVCDFVQNTLYAASNGVLLSNFVLPPFFIPGSSGPWDYLGKMSSQYDVSNGYGIQAASPTTDTQIGGEQKAVIHAPTRGARLGEHLHNGRMVWCIGTLTHTQRRRKGHKYSRTYRRGARV